MIQDTAFIGRRYHITEEDDYFDNVLPLLNDIQSNETIEAEPQYSGGKLIGWSIVTTWN